MSVKSPLPAFAREMLESCPSTGDGVHLWLFRVARVMHPYFEDKNEIVSRIEAATSGCGRDVPLGEIEAAVANSEAYAWQPGRRVVVRPATRPTWPSANQEQVEAIAGEGIGLVDLWGASPVHFVDDECAEEIVDVLFPGNPLICCGKRIDTDFGTGRREEWRGKLARQQFIVPSPMTAEEGQRKSGTGISPRTLENTGPRRFLVIEFDHGHTDTHAAVLWHLGKLAPLVLVVHSGGKSLHGWFACAGQPEEKVLRFMRYAVSLGADPATWTRCQFVRMPGGMRPPGKNNKWAQRQQVFHFNPENLP